MKHITGNNTGNICRTNIMSSVKQTFLNPAPPDSGEYSGYFDRNAGFAKTSCPSNGQTHRPESVQARNDLHTPQKPTGKLSHAASVRKNYCKQWYLSGMNELYGTSIGTTKQKIYGNGISGIAGRNGKSVDGDSSGFSR